MKVKELIAMLKKLGIKIPRKANKSVLEKLLAKATKPVAKPKDALAEAFEKAAEPVVEPARQMGTNNKPMVICPHTGNLKNDYT